VTRALLHQRGDSLVYFRHPFLHAGKDLTTKRALERFLSKRGYTIAPVTIDNQEWVFAEAYVRAQNRGDTATATRIADAYITYMNDVVAFFEQRSVEVVGREIRQVLLLHVNTLNVDRFDALVTMMKNRGYSFISIGRALEDSAYRLPDSYAGPVGLSWIHRWGLTRGMPLVPEPREPAWVARLIQN
jgi:peptidoglycan-N-acetylglucosamine deacetylase